jgi:hypothetical protein
MRPGLIVLLVLGILLGFCAVGWSAPFLVCDPYPKTGTQPDSFTVVPDGGTPVSVPVTTNTDGSVSLHMDLAGISTGNHNYTVTAHSAMWGDSAPVPFAFQKSVPSSPTGIQIKAQ